MPEKTHEVLTTPAPETKVGPIHEYTEEQTGKIKALREASLDIALRRFWLILEPTVCRHAPAPPNGPVLRLGA